MAAAYVQGKHVSPHVRAIIVPGSVLVRRKAEDSRMPNPDFVLNQPRYLSGSILLTGDNFGCGSSREHAPWSIREYGFRVTDALRWGSYFFSSLTFM